ncbi:MAG: hypothetical protein ACE5FJ_07980 [Gemmatimonadales bacterium]
MKSLMALLRPVSWAARGDVGSLSTMIVILILVGVLPSYVSMVVQHDALQSVAVALGTSELGFHVGVMHAGIERLIAFDRLSPPFTVIIAGMMVHVIATESLALDRVERRQLAVMLVAACGPLVLQRWVEMIVVMVRLESVASVGDVVELSQFAATAWLTPFEAFGKLGAEIGRRASAFALWTVGIWSAQLWAWKARSRLAVYAPVVGLAFGCLVTLLLGPTVIRLILRGGA